MQHKKRLLIAIKNTEWLDIKAVEWIDKERYTNTKKIE